MRLLVKLRFNRAVAVENTGSLNGQLFKGIIHADTLFSAIAHQWAMIPGVYDLAKLISRLNSESPPFQISSAFPFIGEKFYLPTPYGTNDLYIDLAKNVPFIELSDFLKLAHGNRQNFTKSIQGNPIVNLVTAFTSPRVTIDRLTNATNIYETVGWLIGDGGGLYFIIVLQDEALKETLELCIRLLGERGIGGDRSIGYGVFDADINSIDNDLRWSELFEPNTRKGKSYCSLSLCCPADNKEISEAISYRIITRKGWILSSASFKQMKRRECKMFSEGSLFKHPIRGCLADVTPSQFRTEHPVFRYGLGMMVAGDWCDDE